MNISEQYPDLDQWLRYGGTMKVRPAPDKKIELLLGDAGGIPEDGKFLVQTPDEAFEKANSVLKRWRAESKITLDSLVTGEIKSTKDEFIQVPGWPPEKNPYYEGS
jgi:hypothetical protein